MFKKIKNIFLTVVFLQIFVLFFSDLTAAIFSSILGDFVEFIVSGEKIAEMTIILFCAFLFVCYIVVPFITYLSNKLFFLKSIECDQEIFENLMNQNPAKIIKFDAGDLATKIIEEQNELRWSIVDSSVYKIEFVLIPTMIIYIGINTHWIISLIVSIMAFVQVLKANIFSSLKNDIEVNAMVKEQEFSQKVFNTADSIEFIIINKFQTLIQPVLLRYNSEYINNEFYDKSVKLPIYDWISKLIDILFYIILILFCFFFESKGLISLGMIVTGIYVYGYIVAEFENLQKYFESIKMKNSMEQDLGMILSGEINAAENTDFISLEFSDFVAKIGNKKINYKGREIRSGDIVAVCGDNGSGKSTLLSYILGLTYSSQMNYEINGKHIDIAYLKKDFDYIDTESVITCDSIAEYINSSFASEEKQNYLMERYNLEGLTYRNGNELSGGERKRIDLVRALLDSKKVLIIDEPEVFLDSYWKRRIAEDLKKSDKTIICVTHDPIFVEIASKVINV